MNRFAYARATTLPDILAALDDDHRPIAGGTDLVGLLKEDLIAPQALISLSALPGLSHIEIQENDLHIGALMGLSDLLGALESKPTLACLYQALLRTATPQLRHMGTLGGNLLQRPRCWYFRNKLTHCIRKGGQTCFAFRGENKYHAILGGGPCFIVHPSDPAVALLALDASVKLVSLREERLLPLEEFYLLPKQDAHKETALAIDELSSEVIVPIPSGRTRSTYLKVSERQSWDFALVSVAVKLDFDGDVVKQARIALGGVAPIPWRAKEAENILQGHMLDAKTIQKTAQAATSGARPLAQNAFKIELVQGAVKQVLKSLLSGPIV